MPTISNSGNHKMKTRSLARLEPNGNTNSISENEQPNIGDLMDITVGSLDTMKKETSKIPKMKQDLQDGKITVD